MATQDNLFGQLGAVGLVILLLLAAMFLLRRKGAWRAAAFLGREASTSTLRVLGRQALTGQHALFAIEVEGVRFLIATHPAGVQISRLEASFPRELQKSLKSAAGEQNA